LLSAKGVYWKLYQLQYKDQELGAALAAAQAQPRPEARAD